MDKEEILDLISDIDLLSKYSEFIPNSYKASYNQNLVRIKSKINLLNDEISNKVMLEKTQETEVIEKPSYQNIRTYLPDGIYKEIFHDVIESIIPVIDENNKLTLKDLFLAQNKSFLDFIEHYQQLDEIQNINFEKNKLEIENRGWIKVGEILTNSLVIDNTMLKTSLEYQSNKPDFFIGESLIELKMISPNTLKRALKLQRWLFKISEKSTFKN